MLTLGKFAIKIRGLIDNPEGAKKLRTIKRHHQGRVALGE